jgi:predicted TIM-barrel fold metal-dependent hydrolase
MVNNHIHIFSTEDIPDKFLPLRLVRWLAKKDRKVFNWILHNINPFSDKDVLDRYLDFVRVGKLGSQKAIFENIMKEYPKGIEFNVLTMDMAFMGAGKVPRPYEAQLKELSELNKQYPQINNFVHIDVRRSNYLEIFNNCINVLCFKGVKLYPPLGVAPFDYRFERIYTECEKNNIPIMAHCTDGNPVHFKGSRKELVQLLCKYGFPIDTHKTNKELCSLFTHPKNYERLLQKYPKLNFCLAHFGRGHEWDYVILDMMDKYDNLFVDCSYAMANESYWYKFKLQLITNLKLRSNCLFGSDYYMNVIENTEQQWSCKLRVFLGEEIWNDIANKNANKYFKR